MEKIFYLCDGERENCKKKRNCRKAQSSGVHDGFS